MPIVPASLTEGLSEGNNTVTFRMRDWIKIPKIFIANDITNLSGWKNMTNDKEKIGAVLPRSAISLIVWATAIVTLWAIVGTARGQGLGIPGSDQPAAGRWDGLVNQPSFLCNTALLLTDGRVMVHQYGDPHNHGQGMNNWWALTPDANGSYLNGTWSQLASMSSTYGPLYFASAVLPDGRVIVEGGEYNFLNLVETNEGSI